MKPDLKITHDITIKVLLQRLLYSKTKTKSQIITKFAAAVEDVLE